jgi:hypothetical protein
MTRCVLCGRRLWFARYGFLILTREYRWHSRVCPA